ncbi:MAG: hypothetical protein WKF30_06320 [Pyrinomonadaceae bacterium]
MSGTPIRRPNGQTREKRRRRRLLALRKLDYEMEVGCSSAE